MIRWFSIIAVIVLVLGPISGCGEREAEDAVGESREPLWPCPTGNFVGDNVTPFGCPTTPKVSWSVELPGAKCTPPIVDDAGRIIVGTSEGVKCFSPEGEFVWTTEVSSHINAGPALDNHSRIVVPYGDTVTFINLDGSKITTQKISKLAAHHPTVDSEGNIYIYCMEPVDISQVGPNPPEDLPAESNFRGHIYVFDHEFKQIEHIETGIINCPMRVKGKDGQTSGVYYAPKLFDKWRPETESDPVFWKTTLLSTSEDFRPVPLHEIEHGVVDMFTDRDGILHLFGHIEHLPLPEELNIPTNEYGFVYKVQSFFCKPETGELHKEHWPWMTPEEPATGTYKKFRKHFNRVRFYHMAKGMDAFKSALGAGEDEEHKGCHHGPGENVLDEVKEFVKGCWYLIISETGRMLGGTESIKCFDVASNKVIWEIDGDPSSIALAGDGLMYCLERFADDDKCVLKCYADKG